MVLESGEDSTSYSSSDHFEGVKDTVREHSSTTRFGQEKRRTPRGRKMKDGRGVNTGGEGRSRGINGLRGLMEGERKGGLLVGTLYFYRNNRSNLILLIRKDS